MLISDALTTACHAASARSGEVLTVEQLEPKPRVTSSRGGEEEREEEVTSRLWRTGHMSAWWFLFSQSAGFLSGGEPQIEAKL